MVALKGGTNEGHKGEKHLGKPGHAQRRYKATCICCIYVYLSTNLALVTRSVLPEMEIYLEESGK